MSYNNYNTRNSARYNTPGKFVYGGELTPGPPRGPRTRMEPGDVKMWIQQQRMPFRQQYRNRPQQENQEQQQQMEQQEQPEQKQQVQNLPAPPPPPPPPAITSPSAQQQALETGDVEMKTEVKSGKASSESGTLAYRPYWMKSKMAGVKKITNKERRRRQNENLRKLITPKNALMVLNEMMPGEQLVSQFKVEPVSTSKYYQPNTPNFCADLNLHGTSYKGYGENKIMARNAAAEQAIRDLIIKRMTRVIGSEKAAQSGGEGVEGGEGGEESSEEAEGEGAGAGVGEALPMIQLASFALHKLFSEWEYDGHRVPQFRPNGNTGDNGSEASGPASGPAGGAGAAGAKRAGGGAGGGSAAKHKPRALPANASAMHPCMLLTYMRPHLEYRELAVEGDRPQNMLFTMGVEVDSVTYIGKAVNKREARKLAARSACTELFGVQFDSEPTALAPQPAA